MNRRGRKPLDANTEIKTTHGLFLSGIIVDRTRRMVPRDNPTTQIVTYTVQGNDDRKYYVDDHAPESYHELNSNICFPVYIKTYIRKNGEASYTINIQKVEAGKGEHF